LRKTTISGIENLEIELFEIPYPGKIIGKAVVDANARMVGVVRSIQFSVIKGDLKLVVRSQDKEKAISISAVDNIGNVVHLAEVLLEFEEIDLDDVVRLRAEVEAEIRAFMT